MEEPTLIYEDRNFLAVNKPTGLLVHGIRRQVENSKEQGAGKKEETTLVDWLIGKYPEIKTVGDDPETRPGIVHRLDRETSGVMLIARNQEYFEYLKSLFQRHAIKKTYLALVFGELKDKSGRIDKPIGIHNGTVKRSVASNKMSKEAITDYRLTNVFCVDPKEQFSLLKIEPKTGRTHQIRVHLASIGHPVVGDRLYGPRRQPPWAERIMLHAMSLEFPLVESSPLRTHTATGRRFRVEAEPPRDYQKVIESLENMKRSYPHDGACKDRVICYNESCTN